MIIDTIDHLNRYAVPKAEAILNFIARQDCANLPDGEMLIEGHKLFVRIMSYQPKPAVENRFETHLCYADVQYLASGAEIIQISRSRNLTALTEYDIKEDHQFFEAPDEITDLIVQQGDFTVFYPNEAHRPACSYAGCNELVKKLVFKVKIN